MKSKKFVITGGHHNSALVVAKELIARGHHVVWIGHRHAASKDTNDSAEYIEVKAAGIPFYELKAGKSSLDWRNVIRIPSGFLNARRLLRHVRPDAIISFGGYLGLTVGVSGHTLGIPLYLHEQTSIAGKANRVSARLAQRIYLTWESSHTYYPSNKSRVVGLPIRSSFINPPKTKIFANRKPVILILCGKQGSHTVNKLIFAHLHELIEKYNLIHQTGTSSVTGDYDKALALKESLAVNSASYYQPHGYIPEDTIAMYMANADIVVGRSGAHTTYELGLMGKKAILIPLMTTHQHEQLHNARILEKAGSALILPQSELSYPHLEKSIEKMLNRQQPSPLSLPRNAADVLCNDIEQYV